MAIYPEIVSIDDDSEEDDIENKPNYVRHIEKFDFRQICPENADCLQHCPLSDFVDPGGLTWRLKVLARNSAATCMSIFLVPDDTLNDAFAGKWSRKTKFRFGVRSPQVGTSFDRSKVQHWKEETFPFGRDQGDRGFWEFVSWENLKALTKPEEEGVVELVVECYEVLPPPPYNSKKATGMVGLKNQGATCYMNSLLQTLYHCNKLRAAVYAMPTAEEEADAKNLALALQRVFWRLQTSEEAVSTKELTETFGWTSGDAFQQQDVQELNRVLCDRLEEKMKGTCVEGTIKALFEGQVRSFIRCVNVDYESAREETFYDISLDVKGCATLEESFAKYVEVERLDGENQYDAEGDFGKQDAEKGVRFLQFPPVLNLQLKRFEYDMMSDTMVKINDKFEFPEKLNVNPFLVDQNEEPNNYVLHSVLVHSGGVHGGHYYAYIRPQSSFGPPPPPNSGEDEDDKKRKQSKYFKFNDEIVRTAKDSDAFAFGGAVSGQRYMNFSSAYMLVYVKESELDEIMIPVKDEDIPKHLSERFLKEIEDSVSKKAAQIKDTKLRNIHIVTAKDVAVFDQYGDGMLDFANSQHKWKLPKDACFYELLLQIEKKLSVPLSRQRLWTMELKEDHRVRRVSRCITKSDLDTEIGASLTNKKSKYFYLEVLEEEQSRGSMSLAAHYKPVRAESMGQVYCGVRPYPPLTAPEDLISQPLEEEQEEAVSDLAVTELDKERVLAEYIDFELEISHKLCFFKYFDPQNPRLIRNKRLPGLDNRLLLPVPDVAERELMFTGSAYVREDATFNDLIPLLKDLRQNQQRHAMDQDDEQESALFELWNNESLFALTALSLSQRLDESSIANGDVIIFSQPSATAMDPVSSHETLVRNSSEDTLSNEVVVVDEGQSPPTTPPLTTSPTLVVDSPTHFIEPAVMSEVDTPLPLPSSIKDYFEYRAKRIVVRFFPKTSTEPIPPTIKAHNDSNHGLMAKEEFSVGESDCFELEFVIDQSLESMLKNLAFVLQVDDHKKIRLYNHFVVDSKCFSSLVQNVTDYYGEIAQKSIGATDLLSIATFVGCRKETVLFYDVMPYTWKQLYNHHVLQLTLNNYQLTKHIIDQSSPTSSSKRRAEENDDESGEVVTIRPVSNGRLWHTSYSPGTGEVTLFVRVPSFDTVYNVLEEITHIYPQLPRDKLRVANVFNRRVTGFIKQHITASHQIIHHNYSASINYAVAPKRHSMLLLEEEEETQEEVKEEGEMKEELRISKPDRVLIQVVWCSRVRSSSYPNLVELHGLPYLTYVSDGESLDAFISRVQPYIPPCYPSLSECPKPVFIGGDNMATLWEDSFAETDLKEFLETLHRDDLDSKLPTLGFEMSAPVKRNINIKRRKKEGGIKIDC